MKHPRSEAGAVGGIAEERVRGFILQARTQTQKIIPASSSLARSQSICLNVGNPVEDMAPRFVPQPRRRAHEIIPAASTFSPPTTTYDYMSAFDVDTRAEYTAPLSISQPRRATHKFIPESSTLSTTYDFMSTYDENTPAEDKASRFVPQPRRAMHKIIPESSTSSTSYMSAYDVDTPAEDTATRFVPQTRRTKDKIIPETNTLYSTLMLPYDMDTPAEDTTPRFLPERRRATHKTISETRTFGSSYMLPYDINTPAEDTVPQASPPTQSIIPAATSSSVRQMKRRRNFSLEEKKKLAGLIKNHESIWNLQTAEHQNIDVVGASWKRISDEMQRSVEDCKSAWRALKDSNRYYKNKKMPVQKSGSGLELDMLQEEEDCASEEACEWELSDSLSFLRSTSSQRKTFATPLVAEDTRDCASRQTTYSYASTPSPANRRISNLEDKADSIINIMSNVLEKDKSELKYKGMLANLDDLLQKLPEEDVMELNVKFISMTVEAIKKNKS